MIGAGVDVSVLPVIGLAGRIDWGVHTYDATGTNGVDPQNGGIVGSVSYDTTRNELDPQYAAAEDWQPGVSGLTVELHGTIPCGTNPGTPCDARGDYELAPDGSYAQGQLLNTYVSETWERPTSGPSGNDCLARDVDGNPLVYPTDQQVLPVGANKGCLEGPLMGVQFGTYATDQGTPDANFGAAVDGNYGFGDGCFDGELVVVDPSAPICAVSGGSITGVFRAAGTIATVVRSGGTMPRSSARAARSPRSSARAARSPRSSARAARSPRSSARPVPRRVRSATVLTDTTATFGANGVVAGDIVLNTTDGS